MECARWWTCSFGNTSGWAVKLNSSIARVVSLGPARPGRRRHRRERDTGLRTGTSRNLPASIYSCPQGMTSNDVGRPFILVAHSVWPAAELTPPARLNC